MNDVIEAHKFSINNFDALKEDSLCGCFYCNSIFTPDKIIDWTIEPNGGKTALCPYCYIDSVIGINSGFPITKEFLSKMNDYWF